MAAGPGKYDDMCSLVRIATKAEAVIVIVVGGDRGDGFSMQGTPRMILQTPELLRFMADGIDGDNAKMVAGDAT